MHVISHDVHPGKRAQSQKVKKNCSDKALYVIRSFVRYKKDALIEKQRYAQVYYDFSR